MITFRNLTHSDRALLEQACAADLWHRDWIKTWFFFVPQCMTILGSDEAGPILFLRMQPKGEAVYIFAQFVCRDQARSARAMLEGFEIVKARIRLGGYKRIVMDSISPLLVRFCLKKLGFQPYPEPNSYSYEL